MCKALLEYGKEELGFEQVQMLVMPENEVSLHLAEELGFVFEEMIVWDDVKYCRLFLANRNG